METVECHNQDNQRREEAASVTDPGLGRHLDRQSLRDDPPASPPFTDVVSPDGRIEHFTYADLAEKFAKAIGGTLVNQRRMPW